MKIILNAITLLSFLLVPIGGFCSYLRDLENVRKFELSHLYEDEPRFQKSLLLMDMIKDTQDSAKKNQLKTLLEVELLSLMDHYLYLIERIDEGHVWTLKAFEETTSEKDAVFWGTHVLEEQIRLNELHQEREKIKALLKYSY